MADNYNHKPEHSAMGEEASAGADVFPPPKAEVSAPPLDTSSQANVEEMETSKESNPINVYSSMAAGSNCSDSPMIDLMELQADANLAANHMLSIKRSSDLERQWAIWDFEVSLHQQEAKEAAANERAKIVHSRRDLNAKVKCTKAVMKAKYDYWMAIQEARTIRCSKLQELEAAYSVALGENAATKSIQCTTLCREHVKTYAQVGGMSPRCRKQKSPRLSFHMSSYPAPCSAASQRESVCLLPCLIRAITFITSIYSICQDTPDRGATICNHFSQARTQTVPMAKKVAFLTRSPGRHIHRQDFPHGLAGRTVEPQEKRDC